MIHQVPNNGRNLTLSESNELVEIFKSQVAALGQLFACSGNSSRAKTWDDV